MSNFKNIMRRTRKYVAETRKNFNSKAVELKKLNPYKGSPYYDRQVSDLEERIEKERIRIAESARKDLMIILEDMRKNVAKRLTKAPTQEISATLALLGQLEQLTPGDIQLYAQPMADCPLALRRLRELARQHDMMIVIPDPDDMFHAVDVLEGNLANLLGHYNGDDENSLGTVRTLLRYLQGDEDYQGTSAKSADNVDAMFWRDIIQIGTPDMLDDGTTPRSVRAELFFKDLDGLLSYMEKRTEGMSDFAAQQEKEKILNECPSQYGAAYRCYRSKGEKLPLNVTVNNK